MKINTPVLTNKAGATWTLFSDRTNSNKVSQVNDVLFMLTNERTLVKTTDYGETIQTVYTSNDSDIIVSQVLAVNENLVLAVIQNRNNMEFNLYSFKYNSSTGTWTTTFVYMTYDFMVACINKRDNSLYIFDNTKIYKISYDDVEDNYDSQAEDAIIELAIAASSEFNQVVTGYPTIITRDNYDILLWTVYQPTSTAGQVQLISFNIDDLDYPAVVTYWDTSVVYEGLSCLPVYVPDSDILIFASASLGLVYCGFSDYSRTQMLPATEQSTAVIYSSICYTRDGRLIVTKEPSDVSLGISRVAYTDNFTTWHDCKDANNNDITTVSMAQVIECDSGKLIAAGGYGQSDPVYGTISNYSSLPVTGDQAKEYVRQFKAYVQSLKQT